MDCGRRDGLALLCRDVVLGGRLKRGLHTLHARLDYIERVHDERRHRAGGQAGHRLDLRGREARVVGGDHGFFMGVAWLGSGNAHRQQVAATVEGECCCSRLSLECG